MHQEWRWENVWLTSGSPVRWDSHPFWIFFWHLGTDCWCFLGYGSSQKKWIAATLEPRCTLHSSDILSWVFRCLGFLMASSDCRGKLRGTSSPLVGLVLRSGEKKSLAYSISTKHCRPHCFSFSCNLIKRRVVVASLSGFRDEYLTRLLWCSGVVLSLFQMSLEKTGSVKLLGTFLGSLCLYHCLSISVHDRKSGTILKVMQSQVHQPIQNTTQMFACWSFACNAAAGACNNLSITS